jgi:hypothetical protein
VPIITVAEIQEAIEIGGACLTGGQLGFLSKLADRMAGSVKKFLGYDPVFGRRTEYYPELPQNNIESDMLIAGYEARSSNRVYPYGSGDYSRTYLYLRHIPVRNIVSVNENPSAYDNSATPVFGVDTLLADGDYYVDWKEAGYSYSGYLRRQIGTWTTYPRTIEVVYDAGYTDAEMEDKAPDIKQAVLDATIYNYIRNVARAQAVKTGGIAASVSIKDFSVSFDNSQLKAGSDEYDLPADVMLRLTPYRRYSQFL